MAIEDHLTFRLDRNSRENLEYLLNDLAITKSQLIRRSIRLMKELMEIKKERGEILIRTEKGDRELILLS